MQFENRVRDGTHFAQLRAEDTLTLYLELSQSKGEDWVSGCGGVVMMGNINFILGVMMITKWEMEE